jgi:hypothetical protein
MSVSILGRSSCERADFEGRGAGADSS